MRKDKKKVDRVEVGTISGYHASQRDQSTDGVYYFASDRTIKLIETGSDRFGQKKLALPSGQPLVAYGLEVETETSLFDTSEGDLPLATVLKRVVFADFPERLWRFEHDCSLANGRCSGTNIHGAPACGSAECVSSLMTREAVRNMYPKFQALYDTLFPMYKISASATGHCGMHVNISNACFSKNPAKAETAIKKLYCLINGDFAFFAPLFLRDVNRADYCVPQKPRAWSFDKWRDHCKKNLSLDERYEHSVAVNRAHYADGRIELRLVGGQANYASFRNTMECVFHLVEACKKLSWSDLDDKTKVFAGCNKYVLSRLSKLVNDGVLDRETYETIKTGHDSSVNFDLAA